MRIRIPMPLRRRPAILGFFACGRRLGMRQNCSDVSFNEMGIRRWEGVINLRATSVRESEPVVGEAAPREVVEPCFT
jgi:hypothetical protein